MNPTRSRNIERYDTAYECEGRVLKIRCQDGEVIHLIRANYGRFSITICNEHGDTDWSVNCMSPRSYRVLYNECNFQQNCSIIASTTQFGDPCPNTLKYLEAHYQCLSIGTTTTRTLRPWISHSQQSMGNSTPSDSSKATSNLSTVILSTTPLLNQNVTSNSYWTTSSSSKFLKKKDMFDTLFRKDSSETEVEGFEHNRSITSSSNEFPFSTILQAVSSPPLQRQQIFPITTNVLHKSNFHVIQAHTWVWICCFLSLSIFSSFYY